MTRGLFAEWQPRYAEHGIATFPVRGKVPAIRNYLRLRPSGSRSLIERFADASALGFAPKPSGIVVVDVDTPRDTVLADALAFYGDTPFVVRSGGGNFQAWYRRTDEGRHIRPDPSVPVDILGDGFVVAPPSLGDKGSYEVVQGSLADLPTLPTLKNRPLAKGSDAWLTSSEDEPVGEGRRNRSLWRHCMREAHHCDDFDALVDIACTANADYLPPLPDDEVLKVAGSAWRYMERGENRVGLGGHVVTRHDEVDDLLYSSPDAYILLTIVRRRHWGREFFLANAMAAHMPGGGWTEKRFANARRDLERAGKIQLIRHAGKHRGPALFRLADRRR